MIDASFKKALTILIRRFESDRAYVAYHIICSATLDDAIVVLQLLKVQELLPFVLASTSMTDPITELMFSFCPVAPDWYTTSIG